MRTTRVGRGWHPDGTKDFKYADLDQPTHASPPFPLRACWHRVPEHLENRLLVAAIEQLLRDDRILRHVFELRRQRRNAVVVGSEADVIDPRDLDDMIDVIDDVMHAAARDRMLLAVGRPRRLQLRRVLRLSSAGDRLPRGRDRLVLPPAQVGGVEVDHHDPAVALN